MPSWVLLRVKLCVYKSSHAHPYTFLCYMVSESKSPPLIVIMENNFKPTVLGLSLIKVAFCWGKLTPAIHILFPMHRKETAGTTFTHIFQNNWFWSEDQAWKIGAQMFKVCQHYMRLKTGEVAGSLNKVTSSSFYKIKHKGYKGQKDPNCHIDFAMLFLTVVLQHSDISLHPLAP